MMPPRTGDRALFWTLAVAAFALAAAGFAARAADRVAAGYDRSRASYAIVRVISPEGDLGMATAQAALAHAPHVVRVSPLTAQEAAQIMQRSGVNTSGLVLPQLNLIQVELTAEPAGVDVADDLRAALTGGGITAEISQQPPDAAPSRLRDAAYWAAGLFALVIALIVSLAARSLVPRRNDLITVLADLGATSGEAAGRVADEAASIGLRAGFVGAFLAGVAGVAAVLALVPYATPRALPQIILPIDTAPLLIAPLLTAIAAGFGARGSAESSYASAARIA